MTGDAPAIARGRARACKSMQNRTLDGAPALTGEPEAP